MAINPSIERFPESDFCPGFTRGNFISGCRFSCVLCYLDAASGRFNGGKKITSVASVEKTVKAVEKWFSEIGDKADMVNTGEVGDSFALFDNQTPAAAGEPSFFPLGSSSAVSNITKTLTELFHGRKQQVLYLTKSSGPAVIQAAASPQSIFSFSVNPEAACRAFGAPFVQWDTLRAVARQGKQIRLRLDPLVPVYNWRSVYENYIRFLSWEKGLIYPEMFTIGSLRLTAANYRLRRAQKVDLLKYVDYDKKGGSHPYRIPYIMRRDMYEFLIGLLRTYFPNSRIGLCKEPEDMRARCKVEKGDCNCQL